MTSEDNRVARGREEKALRAMPEGLEAWLSGHEEVWGGTRLERRPAGAVLVLRFTSDPDHWLAEARKRSPEPDLLFAERAATSETDRRRLMRRILDEKAELEAILNGRVVYVRDFIDTERCTEGPPDGVDIGVIGPEGDTIRAEVAKRYGDVVRIEYLGPSESVITAVPWRRYTSLTDREIEVEYSSFAQREPIEPAIVEGAYDVKVTIREIAPVYAEELIPVARSRRILLSSPLSGRRLLDGARDEEG